MESGETAPPESRVSLEDAYRMHHERVFAAAYRITENAAEAEDVLQAVFLRLLKRAPRDGSLDLGRDPERYLARAAINAALDVLRSRKRARVVQLDEARETARQAAVSVDEAADNERRRDLLRTAVAKLDGRAAEIVALPFLRGIQQHGDSPNVTDEHVASGRGPAPRKKQAQERSWIYLMEVRHE